MNTPPVRSLLALSACFVAFLTLDPLRGESFVLTLEQSSDLQQWSPVEITPEMLDADGRIVLPGEGGSVFFRLSTTSGPAPKMVTVDGGTLVTSNSLNGTVISDFQIQRHEVTWGEWKAVRDEALARGYDIGTSGEGCADDHPVNSVDWYEVVKWCNLKSEIEGLTPVYKVSGNVYRTAEHSPNWDSSADGYRLPSSAEWEFAARGGNQTNGYTYSGSDNLNEVGWYADNSGGAECPMSFDKGTWPVGKKAPNELGLYDMSGNVFEWCWDLSGATRRIRGGDWLRDADEGAAVSNNNFNGSPDYAWLNNGFRLARSSGN